MLRSVSLSLSPSGVDYNALVGEDCCPDRSLLLGAPAPAEGHAATASGLFRLFLQDLPHPLLDNEASAPLFRLCKGASSRPATNITAHP